MTNETNDSNSPETPSGSEQSAPQKTDYFAAGKDNAKLVYILYFVALIPAVLGLIGIPTAGILGLAAIVGVIFALMNKAAVDENIATHYEFQFNTFWKGFVLGLGASLFMVILPGFAKYIGFILYVCVIVWFGIRSFKGYELLNQGKPHPNPGTWSID